MKIRIGNSQPSWKTHGYHSRVVTVFVFMVCLWFMPSLPAEEPTESELRDVRKMMAGLILGVDRTMLDLCLVVQGQMPVGEVPQDLGLIQGVALEGKEQQVLVDVLEESLLRVYKLDKRIVFQDEELNFLKQSLGFGGLWMYIELREEKGFQHSRENVRSELSALLKEESDALQVLAAIQSAHKFDLQALPEVNTPPSVPLNQEHDDHHRKDLPNKPSGGSGVFMAVGGPYGLDGVLQFRFGGAKRSALGRHGGAKASEQAIHDSFLAIQDLHNTDTTFGHVQGSDEHLWAMANASLALIGAGYDHRMPSRFRKTIEKILDELRGIPVDASGLVSANIAVHAAVTSVFVETAAMTGDEELKIVAQHMSTALVNAQFQEGEHAGSWPATSSGVDADLRATAMAIRALFVAQDDELNVGASLEIARGWLHPMLERAIPDGPAVADTGYLLFAAILTGFDPSSPGLLPIRSAIGLNPTLYLERWNSEQDLFWTLGLFQLGGTTWTAYNEVSRDRKVNQSKALLEKGRDEMLMIPDGLLNYTMALEAFYLYQRIEKDG